MLLTDIDALERKVLKWALRKLGLHFSYPRKLLAASVEVGGLGWEPWWHRVLRERTHLAQDMCYHPDPEVRMMWDGMRHRWYQQSASGRVQMGGERTALTQRLEEGGVRDYSVQKSWLGAFDLLLRRGGVAWRDRWAPRELRGGDVDLLELAALREEQGHLTEAGARKIREGIENCDIYWLSQLCSAGGTAVFGWHKVKGWEWVAIVAQHLLNAPTMQQTPGWHLLRKGYLGQWNNHTQLGCHDDDGGAGQTVWGEGIMVGALVSRPTQDTVGVVRQLGGSTESGKVEVEWLNGG